MAPPHIPLCNCDSQLTAATVRVRITLRLAVHRRSVCLGAKPLVAYNQSFFFWQLNPYGHSPCVTSSLTRRLACLLCICLAFVKCTYHTYSMLLKILPLTIYTSPLSVQVFTMQIMPILFSLCYNGSLVTWTAVSLTAAKFNLRQPVRVTLPPTVSRWSVLVSSPIWGSWPDIYYCLTFTVLSMSGAPSDERSGLSFVLVIVRPLSVNIYRFTCNAHVSDIYTYSDVYTLYTRPPSVHAENSRSCSFLSSLGYNGSLVTWTVAAAATGLGSSLYSLGADPIEKTVSNNSFIVASVYLSPRKPAATCCFIGRS
jgi:hypothetical protein